jgi:hypothetical protein
LCACDCRNTADVGLQRSIVLPHPDEFDSVLCALASDIHLNGRNELLIGTYGRELLGYQLNDSQTAYQLIWHQTMAHPIYVSVVDGWIALADRHPLTFIFMCSDALLTSLSISCLVCFVLSCAMFIILVSLQALDAHDVNFDGLQELIVVGSFGITILQHDHRFALNKLHQRCQILDEIRTLEAQL